MRTPVTVACLTALAALVGWGASPAAASGPGQLTCLGTSTITFSPGLTNTSRPVTITSTNEFPSCVSLTDSKIKSAGFTAVVHATRACTHLHKPGSGSRTIIYNTGNTSTYTSTFTANYVGGQLLVADAGSVTAGQFEGSAFTSQAVYLVDLTKCNTDEGLTSTSGSFEIHILPVPILP